MHLHTGYADIYTHCSSVNTAKTDS